jgi:hypothetical protein
MAGLVPAIHTSPPYSDKISACIVLMATTQRCPGVDARDKRGHYVS